jgi:hypothetical protein
MKAQWLFRAGVALVMLTDVPQITVLETAASVLTIVTCLVWLHSVARTCVINVLHLVAPGRVVHPKRVLDESIGLVLYGIAMWSLWERDSIMHTLICASHRPWASIMITGILMSAMRNVFGLSAWYGDYRTEVLRIVVMLEMYVCVVMSYPYGIYALRLAMDTCHEKLKFFHG